MDGISVLVLESGKVYTGVSFGYQAPNITQFSEIVNSKSHSSSGELVFNTAMSGYVEVLTDPSFFGQIICMTYPHIGNYGVENTWSESGSQLITQENTALRKRNIMVSGLVVKELYTGPVPENRISLSHWLEQEGISGITGIDTRSLTIYLRDNGVENAAILQIQKDGFEEEIEQAVDLIKKLPKMEGQNLVEKVSSNTSNTLPIVSQVNTPYIDNVATEPIIQKKLRVGLLDFGCKHNIIRLLSERVELVEIISQSTPTELILQNNYDFILVSNGPGDPAVLGNELQKIQELLGKVMICGICLGTQLLALSIGAKTYKLSFGHHGINHPVKNMFTNKLYITSQNHGFAVDETTLPKGSEVWFRNTNDDTLEGFINKDLQLYSVQFHPEAAPGPRDTLWIIDYFIEQALMSKNTIGD